MIVADAFPLVVIAIALDALPLGSFSGGSGWIHVAALAIGEDLGEVVHVGSVALVAHQHALDWLGTLVTLHPAVRDLVELGTRVATR